MSFNRFLSVVALVVVAFGFYAMGADDEQRPAAPSTRPSRVLHEQMESMEKPFKQLTSQVGDKSKNASSLQLVEQLQRATLACKTEIPRKVQRMPATQQGEETSNYRQMMVNLLRHELDLEEQLLNNDNTKAAETVKQMDELQKDGHKEFRPQRGERNQPR
jgi:hypothetical protein